ncbi:hypothetical protein [Pedobacter rhizosphaerae]|uniref:Uncharacterized protein n=1 Tax=Pedobacter rhizosphaerae TaxID=390241 RepID=A0A1H9N9Q9_9SPHI|nr:hypothetical protein [Pedobacter rhizosphaerae]SER32133.1 hypothetical protein SAMN04488023_10798 [Pedobacter rhizosphaerae]
MAIIKDGNLSGGLGDLVFGKDGRVRTKGKVTQSEATKKASSVFGKYISPMSKIIRDLFLPTHLHFTDGKMVNRMNSVISTITNQHLHVDGTFSFHAESFERLRGFDFNASSRLFDSLLFHPKLSLANDQLLIGIPHLTVAKHLRWPKGTHFCKLHIQVVFLNPEAGKCESLIDEMDWSRSGDVIEARELKYAISEGTVGIVWVSLTFHQGNATEYALSSKAFHPAGIIGAVYREGTDVLSVAQWKNVKVVFPMK